MKIYVFGSSLTSCYWNGAATYYRGIYKNLHGFGHDITFAEPDIYNRQQNRDCSEIDYATVRVYQTPRDLDKVLSEACDSDLIVKHSGVGADDELLEEEVLRCGSSSTRVAFWDVDAPVTLARVEQNPRDPFRALIPRYDFIFTYGGGDPVVTHYMDLGAKNCFPIYNGLDPDTHQPVAPDQKFKCDLAFVGNRLPDRESRVEQFFLAAAERAPEFQFLLGGEGWGSRSLPQNVRWIGHVRTEHHNVINSSARVVLNINRESMVQTGFSPPTRVFEAAGAAACLITDAWTGIEEFFQPEREILVANGADDIVGYLHQISPSEARRIGSAMHTRALRDHIYELRAKLVDTILQAPKAPEMRAPLVHYAA
jgi:spore maturation protein CgeB